LQNRIEIPYNNIKRLNIRRKGSVGKGAWIGALAGCTVGILVGRVISRQENAVDIAANGIAGAFFGTPVGLGVGLAIGTSKKTIPIKNDPIYYNENSYLLKEYVVETEDSFD
jgi:hypothetical protein